MSDSDGKHSEEDPDQHKLSDERGPPGTNSRIGSTSLTGAKSIDQEQIPGELMKDPLFWYGRYVELEKAYKDLGAVLEERKREQQRQTFMQQTGKDDLEAFYERARGLIGIFSGTLVILYYAKTSGYINISAGILVGAAITITAALDALSLTKFLAKARNYVSNFVGGLRDQA